MVICCRSPRTPRCLGEESPLSSVHPNSLTHLPLCQYPPWKNTQTGQAAHRTKQSARLRLVPGWALPGITCPALTFRHALRKIDVQCLTVALSIGDVQQAPPGGPGPLGGCLGKQTSCCKRDLRQQPFMLYFRDSLWADQPTPAARAPMTDLPRDPTIIWEGTSQVCVGTKRPNWPIQVGPTLPDGVCLYMRLQF